MATIKEYSNLKGRVAAVTGGAGYLGRTMAHTLAEAGADIAIIDIRQDGIDKICAELRDKWQVRTCGLVVDLEKEAEVRAVPEKIIRELGRMDILINNAAFVGTSNTASIYGIVGPDPHLYTDLAMFNPAAYAASKGGVVQFTKWCATVLAPDIRVNAITPGGIFRNQDPKFLERYEFRCPLKRMAHEDDFIGATIFLASDLSRYITGQNIIVDGGFSVW